MASVTIKEVPTEQLGSFHELADNFDAGVCGSAWSELELADVTYLGIYAGQQLIGGLCVKVRVRFGLTVVSAPPFSRDCGLFFVNNSKELAAKNSRHKAVMKALATWLRGKGCTSFVRITLPPNCLDVQPLIWAGFDLTPVFTYQIDFGKFHGGDGLPLSAEKRRDLRKSESDGISTVISDEPARIMPLILASLGRQGVNVDSSSIWKIVERLLERGSAYAVVAHDSSQDLATAFVVTHHDTAKYLFGGTSANHPTAGASCVAHAIEEARSRGYSVFDFEGSMIPAIESYFRGFGGILVPFFRVTRGPLAADLLLRRFGRIP